MTRAKLISSKQPVGISPIKCINFYIDKSAIKRQPLDKTEKTGSITQSFKSSLKPKGLLQSTTG